MSDELTNRLLSWYRVNGRTLPWRENTTPYRVWISEIMLQQTRVEAVKPYYQRFMEELPTVEVLAEVDEQRLLKLWEGLGYYRRAMNLHKAAQMIVNQYGGAFPDTYEQLMTLPGIGAYTAGAIASISYSQRVPAVDGNVIRIFTRLHAYGQDVTRSESKRKIDEYVREMIPLTNPGEFTQAIMDLGATVCLPNAMPKCKECPLSSQCLAYLQNNMLEYPNKPAKRERVIEKYAVLMLMFEKEVAIRKRSNHGLLAGMYEFPMMQGKPSRDEMIAYIRELGIEPIRIQKKDEGKHIFSHKEWHMTGYYVQTSMFDRQKINGELTIVSSRELERLYPMAAAYAIFRKRLIEEE